MGLRESVAEFLEGGDARCELDAAGSPRAWGLGADAPSAAVIVAPATDALKTTHLGLIAGSLDRSLLWEVAGVSLAREVVSDIPAETSVAEWVERLRESGVGLAAIERSDAL
jgi:hypothetical protein